MFCPVERVAEDTAGGAEEAGAQGETSPFFLLYFFPKKLNEDGPRNIANLANQIHAKMIHISTDEDVPYGTYHCTDLGEITWWDFTNAKRPAYSVLCKDKIQKALGITIPDWKESLKKFIGSDLFDKSRII